MKVGIISDTHLGKHPDKIEGLIKTYLNDVDAIIHAGDYKGSKVVNILKRYKNFVGVYGNVDDNSVRELLNEKEIITLSGYRIGIFHGHGEKKTTIERAYDKFKDDKVDIIVFGHSHQPVIMTKQKILIINPGSPTSKRKDRWYSYVILELGKHNICAELKLFNYISCN